MAKGRGGHKGGTLTDYVGMRAENMTRHVPDWDKYPSAENAMRRAGARAALGRQKVPRGPKGTG